MNKTRLRVSAIVLVLLLVCAATASGKREVVRAGNLIFTDNGGISPSVLPRNGSAPITARIAGGIGTADGSHPPALQAVEAEVDRTIQLEAVGLPTCSEQQIVAQDTAAAKRACGDAIVGSGEAEVEVSFPEQAPFSATGPIVLFNGGVRGASTLVLLHAYVNVPAPTAIVVPARVTRIHRDRFGLAIDAEVPRIAGGAGSVTRFDLRIGRRYTYRGERRSFLTAGCPTGHWMTRGQVSFADGTRLDISHLFACTPRTR